MEEYDQVGRQEDKGRRGWGFSTSSRLLMEDVSVCLILRNLGPLHATRNREIPHMRNG